MLQPERRKYILNFLKSNNSVEVESLAEELEVSAMTIRRDLKFLEEEGMIERTYGGAVLNPSLTSETPYLTKEITNVNEKRKIAEYAVKFIEEGMVVGLDGGTTSMEIAKLILNIRNLTIVTPDVIIAGFLAQNSNLEILCTGGNVQNHTGVCLGNIADNFLKNVNIDISFIGTSGFTYDSFSTPTFEKAELKKQFIKSSESAILVTDSSKFGEKSFVKISNFNKLDLIITDNNLGKEKSEKIKELGYEIYLA